MAAAVCKPQISAKIHPGPVIARNHCQVVHLGDTGWSVEGVGVRPVIGCRGGNVWNHFANEQQALLSSFWGCAHVTACLSRPFTTLPEDARIQLAVRLGFSLAGLTLATLQAAQPACAENLRFVSHTLFRLGTSCPGAGW
eukprot:5600961-Amphidinium_carterae.1